MPCRACKSDQFLHGSPVLLIVTHAESDSCALYLMGCSAWPIFRELLGCSIPCLQEHPDIVVFEPAAPGHSPDQFRLSWLRPILTGEFARCLLREFARNLCSSRKAFSACLSASLLFQRSCLMALDCSSFRRDSIIAFSTIFHCGQRVT